MTIRRVGKEAARKCKTNFESRQLDLCGLRESIRVRGAGTCPDLITWPNPRYPRGVGGGLSCHGVRFTPRVLPGDSCRASVYRSARPRRPFPEPWSRPQQIRGSTPTGSRRRRRRRPGPARRRRAAHPPLSGGASPGQVRGSRSAGAGSPAAGAIAVSTARGLHCPRKSGSFGPGAWRVGAQLAARPAPTKRARDLERSFSAFPRRAIGSHRREQAALGGGTCRAVKGH